MEEVRRDGATKVKRSKSDSVSQAVLTYLQQRNYPIEITPGEFSADEMTLSVLVDSASSRQNSILYSCFSSDPTIVNQNFSKFIVWSKDTVTKHKLSDLEYLIAPLFCHLYLEILQRGHYDKANSFFKCHIGNVDKAKCDEHVRHLINSIAVSSNSDVDLMDLKKTFRSNKYVVELSSQSVDKLRAFLAESCHVVLFQVLQTWFSIHQVDNTPATPIREESDTEEAMQTEQEVALMSVNGNCESLDGLLDAIKAVNEEPASLYQCHLSNVKDDVTAGVMSRCYGVAAYSYNSSVFVRDLRTLTRLDRTDRDCDVAVRAHSSTICSMDFIPKYKFLVTASFDRTARLFDLSTYSEQFVYKGHDYPLYRVKACQTGEFFVTASSDYCARLWATDRSETLRVFTGHTQEVTSLTFHPNSLYVITGSGDKTVRMWSLQDGNTVRLLLGSKGTIYATEFSPCGRYLATAGDDRSLRIWSLTTGKQLTEIDVGGVLVDPVMKLSWAESRLAASSIDGVVRVYDMDGVLRNCDSGQYTPISMCHLRTKVLDLSYEFDTFGCLTAQAKTLMTYS